MAAKGIFPILLLAGAVALFMKKKAEEEEKKAACPPHLDLPNPGEDILVDAWKQSAGSPIEAADIVFRHIVPAPCTKQDFKTTVSGEDWLPIAKGKANLSSLYAAIVVAVMDVNMDMENPRDQEQAKMIVQQIATWYSQITGEPMPDVD